MPGIPIISLTVNLGAVEKGTSQLFSYVLLSDALYDPMWFSVFQFTTWDSKVNTVTHQELFQLINDDYF